MHVHMLRVWCACMCTCVRVLCAIKARAILARAILLAVLAVLSCLPSAHPYALASAVRCGGCAVVAASVVLG